MALVHNNKIMDNKALFDFCQTIESLKYPVAGSHDNCFYIYDQIRSVVSEGLIIDLISPLYADPALETVVSSLMADGIRLFCILSLMHRVDQVPAFLSHNTLDDRLPIKELAELQKIAPDLDISFFTKFQWQFFPWSFQKNTGHLIFPNSVILPFTSEKIIAEGSGGVISLVEIPSSQQNFVLNENDESVKVVCKKVKPARTPEATQNRFTDERECLDLYRILRHRNIVPLLSSFTVGDEHRLLFPWYPTTLGEFLMQEKPFGKLNNKSTILSAMAGLASALQAVHEPRWRSRKTPTFYARYGYHHDFRPENILVTDSDFILADFGLAYPAPAIKPPETEWVENIGYYIAPECMDNEFMPQKVGRSYDIWAFGCFVSEMATYIAWGAAGISDFRQQRTTDKYYDEQYRNGYFFDGPSRSLKPQVQDWLQRLSDESKDAPVVSLVSLSRKMLQFSPDSRFDMTVYCASLSFIHAKFLFRTAIDSMTRVLPQLNQYEAKSMIRIMETISRLRAFGDYLGMEDDMKIDCDHFGKTSFADFVKEHLLQISRNQHLFRTDLVSFSHDRLNNEQQSGQVEELDLPIFLDELTTGAIRQLGEALPDQKYFQSLIRKRMLEDSHSEASLSALEECKEPDLLEVGFEAKLRRLQQALEKEISTGSVEENLILGWPRVSNMRTFSRYHHTAIYSNGPGGSDISDKVLVEWVFQSQFPENEPEHTRINKLLRLTTLLQCPKPPEFRVLDCLGFLPPKEQAAGYGFVYLFPTDKRSTYEIEPRPLRNLLDIARYPVTLGDKLRVAKVLSNSLWRLHEHDWLHKNIRSENIIFFEDKARDIRDRKAGHGKHSDPYIIGFHHGRPDGDIFYSDIPSHEEDPEAFLYRHPSYEPGNNRYQKTYDYYGLGIILIELAFWKPAKYLWERYKNSARGDPSFRDIFVKKYVKPLAGIMGNAYMEATHACLGEDVDTKQLLSAHDRGSFNFYSEVVSKLDRCNVD